MRAPVTFLLASLLVIGCTPLRAPAAQSDSAATLSVKDVSLLDEVQATSFRYFQDQSSVTSGLTRDRSKSDSPASMAAVGFSLSAYPVAVRRGLTPRAVAAAYTLKVLRFLWNAPQGPEPEGKAGYKGLFYHFVSMDTGARAWKCELSTIDTALLMAGVLFTREYYDTDSATETEIRDLADRLYRRVDWDWARGNDPKVSLGWTPETGFMPYHWGGYNEGMILYLLGLGSPTHALPDGSWAQWIQTYKTSSEYGKPCITFGPMFGHQYSHVWVDFHGIQDSVNRASGYDYFENSARATYAQQAYARTNPLGFKGYDALTWGITACDGPGDRQVTVNGTARKFLGYSARGIYGDPEDGTIAPTAAAASLPFAPDIVLPTMRQFRSQSELWGRYGYVDAFNPTAGWVDPDVLGIDQGPILLMTENYRDGLIWATMRKSVYLRTGLRRAGFTGGWLAGV